MAGSMRVVGKIAKCMVMVNILGQMEEHMKVNMRTIRRMVKAYTPGMTVEHITANGKTESNTAKACTQ